MIRYDLTGKTALVTGAAKGRGWVVLFHVAASPGWSSLPISGLYVDMLRRIVELSEGMRGGAAGEVRTRASVWQLRQKRKVGQLTRDDPRRLQRVLAGH